MGRPLTQKQSFRYCSSGYSCDHVHPTDLFISQATSAADGCRDASELHDDKVACPMATLMQRWLKGGHPERSFSRLVAPSKKLLNICFTLVASVFLVHLHSGFPDRWCQDQCSVHPDEVQIPLKVVSGEGDEIEVENCTTAILWPWDFFSWMWETGTFLQWVSDEAQAASNRTEEYWLQSSHLDFFKRLDLPRDQLRHTVPLCFHADGVRIYKAQKAWIYSVSSACRKGGSLKTKLVLIIIRESRLIKERTHDAVGALIGYITATLQSGAFPTLDPAGHPFPPDSTQAKRAGKPFANGWRGAFCSFKGDWEARALLHKSRRSYNSTWICDHCLASRVPEFSFGDLRMTASCHNLRFTHEQYMILQGAKQSSWKCVKGWTKDRNLDDARRKVNVSPKIVLYVPKCVC